ncbi:MAG: rod shape-determining protein MreD [Actinobacteria bacterium]|nr:rod shape-determining protein MreD [Actinomycetota bacterium]
MRARFSLLSLLRAALVVLAAALSAVVVPRLGSVGPDLVLLVVVAAALLGGPVKGALLGLGGGWVVDLMPPAAATLGVAALTYAAAGAVSGLWHRDGGGSAFLPALATLAATSTVAAIGILRAATSGWPVPWAAVGWSIVLTTTVGLAVVPLLIRAERALIRRRLA